MKTHIIFILDESGSMGIIKDSTIANFNKFLLGQQAEKGKAKLTLVTFNETHKIIHNKVPLQEVAPLNPGTYQPKNTTALYGTVGAVVSKALTRKQPDKTVLVILTDGLDNVPADYSQHEVAALLKFVQETHNWDVFFLGANIDAVAEAQRMAINASGTLNFMATDSGIAEAYSTLSKAVSEARTTTARTSDSPDWKSD